MPEDLPVQSGAFRVWGAGNARPVLALHCSLAHAGAWSGVAQRLPGVALTAFDLPGHGRAADWDGAADLQALSMTMALGFARDIGGGGPVDLLGHSFGATVCLRLALERPALVRSLVLVEPVLFAAAEAAGSTAYAPFAADHAAVEAAVRGGRPIEAARLFNAPWGAGTTFDELPEAQRRYMAARMNLIVAQGPSLAADTGGLLRAAGLEGIGVPVLLVEGARSPPVIGAIMAELARRLPRAKRLVVPGAGHMVPITHPAAVADGIAAHLAAC